MWSIKQNKNSKDSDWRQVQEVAVAQSANGSGFHLGRLITLRGKRMQTREE